MSQDPSSLVSLPEAECQQLYSALGERPIVLIGMMGAGKSSVGRRLATRLNLPFFDSDQEIELAAGMSISEIFTRYGEGEFRSLEARVVRRLLEGGRAVVATGGGACLNSETRQKIWQLGLPVWLKAEFDVLMRRVRRRADRPLLKTDDPEATLKGLMEQRYPLYAEAQVVVTSRDEPHEVIVEEVIEALCQHLELSFTKGSVHV